MADQQAGWYPDPSGDVAKLRYWDGTQWTNDFTDVQQVIQPAQPVQPTAEPQSRIEVQGNYTNPSNQQMPPQQVYLQEPPQTNGLAIAALICSIVGLCIGPLSIAAIILAALGMRNPRGKGMAIAGLIIGIVALLSWVLLWALGGSAAITAALLDS